MNITVREALTIGGLKHSRLIAGEAGLDRVVSCIDIMEVAEPLLWIKENELLVSTFYMIRDDPKAQLEVIKSMTQANCAALAIKFGRFLGQPPQAMIDLADSYGLPLIDVPNEVPFMDISHPLMTAIVNKHAEWLKYSQKIHRRLTQLALQKNVISAITDELAQCIGMVVAIYDGDFVCRACSKISDNLCEDGKGFGNVFDKLLIRNIRQANLNRSMPAKPLVAVICEHLCRIFPVEAQGRCYGYILVVGGSGSKLSEMQSIAVEHGVTVAALQLIRDDAVIEARQSHKRDLIEDLIAGVFKNRETAISKGELAGMSLDRPYLITVIDIDRLPIVCRGQREEHRLNVQLFRDELLQLSKSAFSTVISSTVAVLRGDSFMAIVPVADRWGTRDDRNQLFEMAKQLQKQLGQRWKGLSVTIGFGRITNNPMQFSERYHAVKKAVDTSRKVHEPGAIVFEDDMQVYTLLSTLGQPLKNFYQEVLGPVDHPTVKNSRELLHTLRVYLECQGNIGEAAEKLFIHRNTLRYRLEGLQKLLGRNLEDNDYRFTLLTALKLRKLIVEEHV